MSQLLLRAGMGVRPTVAGSPPFAPTDLAGLGLWLKAGTGTYTTSAFSTPASADLSPVGGWQDQSGAARHFSTATSAFRPTLRTAVQNGRAVLRFDGVDDRLESSGGAGFPGANFTLFVVHQTSGDGLFFGPLASNFQVRVGRAGADVLSMYDGVDEAISSTLPLARTVWQIAEYQSGPHFWANGVNLDQGGTLGSMVMEMLGMLNNGALALVGDVGEIVLYTAVLSAANRQSVETYLTSGWGL